MPIITLLTDFGTADGYVGEMKGVLLSEVPDASIVDITHEVPAHDVELARLTLARYWKRFPPATIHVAVVDPGVGSSRAALAVSADGRFLVGPDNGVLSAALLVAGAEAVALSVPSHSSATFHGRDVFAPAAARLARGLSIHDLGERAASPIVRRTPEPRREGNGDLVGQVIAIDRFGNAITNLAAIRGELRVANRVVRLRRTYADLADGEIGAVVGSSGLIEISLRDGRAADELALSRGTTVTLRRATGDD
jgi:S-adenosyl-L-methionine hydrolase (adenosine-forming)